MVQYTNTHVSQYRQNVTAKPVVQHIETNSLQQCLFSRANTEHSLTALPIYFVQVTFKGISPPMSSATNSLRETSMWPSSLQDTDSEPAMARALSLVLSKCGLARSGGLTEPLTPAAAAEAAASALGSTDTLDDGVLTHGY